MNLKACSVQLSKQVYVHDYIQSYHLSPGEIKNLMSPSEWNTIYEMSNDEALLQVSQTLILVFNKTSFNFAIYLASDK